MTFWLAMVVCCVALLTTEFLVFVFKQDEHERGLPDVWDARLRASKLRKTVTKEDTEFPRVLIRGLWVFAIFVALAQIVALVHAA